MIDKVRMLTTQQEIMDYSLSQILRLCRQELFKVGEDAGLQGNGFVGKGRRMSASITFQ